MDLMSSADSVSVLTENERKRLEAVWELFQSETVFLIDHLMVLKHVRIICIFLSIYGHPLVLLSSMVCPGQMFYVLLLSLLLYHMNK